MASTNIKYPQDGHLAFAKSLIKDCQETQNPYLDLGNCGITDLNELPELFECEHIETLVFGAWWWDIDKKNQGKQNKSINSGKKNEINSIPQMVSNLKRIKNLVLSNNQISDISFLENLTNLQCLFLGLNKITDISHLGNLACLQHLDLNSNKITDISHLGKLTSLQRLRLRDNEITDISYLGNLACLQYLNLDNNMITDISHLGKLTGLQYLDLDNNKITDISHLGNLACLQHLDLNSNKITDISHLGKLTSLQRLRLRDNEITDISHLGNLTGLQYLDLNSNKITDISHLGNLTGLQYLDLDNNKITDISFLRSLFQLGMKINESLILCSNPINRPPLEIINQGNQAIFDWLSATKEKLNEIKIILIGEPKAGKTSLLKRLKDNSFDEDEAQTDGVNIEDIEFGQCDTFKEQVSIHDITGHFWDFGGQEIMNATHQFFLTKRSVYVLVLDSRKDANNSEQIRTWLQRVKATGGKSPVIVLANQIDINHGFGFENQRELQEEFNLKEEDFIKVSCKTDENIDILKKRLAEIIPTAELLQTEIDEKWIVIKTRLQKETKEKYFLDEHRFNEICKEENLTEKDGQRNAISFFHDLGFVLHFDDLSQDLKEYYVLDPYWITYGTYQVLTSERASKNKGIVNIKDDLEFIINEEEDKRRTYYPISYKKIIYSPNERRFLMDILCEFKLCFHVPSLKIYIIPDLLGTTEPLDTNEIRQDEKNIQFEYEYGSYLPKFVMPNIMAEMYHVINIEHMWRTGCVVQNGNCKSLIASYRNRIKIIVTGEHKQKREFLAVIRFIIDKINKRLFGNINMLIPLPGTDNMHVDYKELLEMEKDDKDSYTIYKPSKKKFKISKLLDGFPREDEVISIGKETFKEMLASQSREMKEMNERQTEEIIGRTKNNFQDVLAEMKNMKLQQKNILVVEIMAKIEDAFEKFSDKINEEIEKKFDKLKQTDADDWQARLELSVPLLNLLGINLGVEFDLKGWANRMYDKLGLEILKKLT